MEINITLTNKEVVNIMQSIGDLASLNLPVHASWNIAKNTKKFTSIFETFAECENQLIQKYAIKDEEGDVRVFENNQYKIAPKFVSQFNSDRLELLDCENTINIHPVNISDLLNDENTNKIKPSTLLNFEFMISEGDEEVKNDNKTGE